MSSIHKTKFGTYRVRWREDGKLRSKTCKSRIEAERWQEKTEPEIEPQFEPHPEAPIESKTIIFKELAERWLSNYAEVRKAPSSVILDRQLLRDYWLPALGHLVLDEIKPTDILDLQAQLRKENRLAIKTINLITSLIHKIFDDAITWQLIDKNPSQGISPLRNAEQDMSFWTFEERDAFLAFAKRENPEVYEIIAMAVHTGLRKGELEGLCRDCLDFKRREIIVKRNYCTKTKKLNNYTKGKNIRHVPMNSTVLEILRRRENFFPHQPVFVLDFAHLAWRYFIPMQRQLGIKVIRFHDLRHTFASHLAMSGVSTFDIQKLLGHQSITMTQRYMHLAPDHLAGTTDVLEESRKDRKGD